MFDLHSARLANFTDIMENNVEIIRQEYQICCMLSRYNISLLDVDSP